MDSIQELLKKLEDLSNREQKTAIEIDLMLQHTRSMYDLLLDLRPQPAMSTIVAPQAQQNTEPAPVANTYTAPTIQLNVPEEEPVALNEDTLPVENKQINIDTTSTIETNVPEDELPAPTAEIVPEQKTQSVLQPIFFNNAPQPGKDIRKTIGINDKYQVMSELFSNNKENYEMVIEELNSFDNFPEAQTWLKAHLADAPGWDEDSYTVQLLYGLMQRFFAENK